MRYIAQKPMKVGDRTVMPGEDVPEAASWPRLSALISGGYLAAVMETETDTQWAREIEARLAAIEQELGIAAGDEVDAVAADGTVEIDLSDWKRGDLNALAKDAGIADPEKLPNIPAVIAAIQDAVDDGTLADLVASRRAQA